MTGVSYAGAAYVPAVTAAATRSFTMPTVPAGSLLLAFFTAGTVPTSITPPSGGGAWTKVNTSGSQSFWWAISTAADSGGTATANFSTSTTAGVLCTAYTNPSGAPINCSGGQPQGATRTAVAFPTATAAAGIGQLIAVAIGSQAPAAVDSRLSNRYSNAGASDIYYSYVYDAGSYTATGATPTYTLNYTGGGGAANWPVTWLVGVTLGNVAPNAPTLNSPATSSTIGRTSTQRFAWTFSDPNAGDSQSAFDLRYSSNGGTSWTTISGTTPNNYLDVAAGTFSAGSYQWQVRTYDSSGTVGAWSASSFFTASSPPAGATLTHPTSGGTVQASDSLGWSAPTQTAYQVQRCADSSGSIDTSTVYFDSGTVTDSTNSIRTQALTFPVNNRYEWLRLRIMNGGLWSSWVPERVLVSYTPPPTPTFTAASSGPDEIAVTVATSAPISGAPPATSVDVAASPDGGVTVEWQRSGLPINSVVVFDLPASKVAYAFEVVSHADNGTSATTGWVTP